ncbi:hypothetical protein SELMODRAFT_425078 [Selaginella moellendorffii]|uniref:Uncharacterized protein n=1 Tax=Selaginella moellendorffii TaxID=88036 RepID=D8SRY7_SELML|nr:hypothetical protein SELMODRAFT_432670 [Selaginella moellendorffii]EFJ12936.1 hypothetical protein SELMODRAFT_425078 [Selaginella moellendorffii]
MQELKVILYHEISGSSSTLISIKDPSLQLVEYGLAWLTNKSQLELKNIDDFFSGRKERWIRLEEPAVLRVLYHHFMTDSDSCQDMLTSKGQGDHSKIGLGLEKLAAFGEAQELDGKVPAEFVRQFLHQENKVLLRNDTFKVPGIYFETAKLERPCTLVDMEVTICMEKHVHHSRCYTSKKYIDDSKKGLLALKVGLLMR